MGFIYKITNTQNNKVYIGQTTRTIEERWKDHSKDYKISKYNCHLYNAMRLYGIEYFVIEEIEEVDNSLLDEREMYWINFYDSFNIGYNCTLGGCGRKGIDRDEIKELWENHPEWTVRELSAYINHDESKVSVILTAIGVSSEERIKRSALKRREVNGQTVIQYSIDGDFIAQYKSSKEAEEITGASQDEINRCCTRARNTYSVKGYIWKRANDDTPIDVWVEANKTKLGKRAVDQYDLEGNFIAQYESIAEASRECGFSKKSRQITMCCTGRINTAYGYIWKYANA